MAHEVTLENRAKQIFAKRGGTLRTREALRFGIHPRTLYQLRDEGELVQLSRGLYRLASLDTDDPDLLTVAKRIPKGVLCLISALSYHDITTEVPHEIHVALPKSVKAPRIDHPPLRFFYFSGPAYSTGIERHTVSDAKLKVYSAPKTVVDCFRFRNQLGLDVAIEALKLCLERRLARPAKIMRLAEGGRVAKVIRPYLEALT